METMIRWEEANEIENVQRIIGKIYCKLHTEWLKDTKNGQIKLHSKTKKMMNISMRIYNDIEKLLKEMPCK